MSLLDDKLETFVAVCETKNFTKAGEILGLTQPAVSHHIKKLEEYGIAADRRTVYDDIETLKHRYFCAKKGKSCSRKKEKSHFCMQNEYAQSAKKCRIKSKTQKQISTKSA